MINIYVRPTALSDVNGRIKYISSSEKQEHLVAVYSDVDAQFWKDLSEHCRKAAAEAGHDKVCEGREWHGAIPNEYARLYFGREQELAKEISEVIKNITGTENITALHWNKTRTNFHFHSVTSENKEINEIQYGAVLTRNTYYDRNGKRSTKKACMDSEGKLLPGCKFYEKGSRIETVKRFGTKENLRDFRINKAIKENLAQKFNEDLKTNEFKVYSKDDLHLRQQKVGKGLSAEKKEAIEAKNRLVRDFNNQVDKYLHLVIKKTPEQESEVVEGIKNVRDDIKQYSLTSNWVNAIRFYLDKLRALIIKLEKLPDRKASFLDQIKAAEAEKKPGKVIGQEREDPGR